MPNQFKNDLKAIVDQLRKNHFEGEGGPLENNEAFIELQRIANLQLRQLHTGQMIEHYIDSAIMLWRRKQVAGGATAIMAAHFIDAFQQVRVAIFGEQLLTDEGAADGPLFADGEMERDFEQFLKSNNFNAVNNETKGLLRRAYEAAYKPDVMLMESGVIRVFGEVYILMDEKQRKEYVLGG